MPWTPVKDELPPEGVEVGTKIDDCNGCRNVQPMTRRGNLWFSQSMYVYYTPTHWFKHA